MKISLAVPRKPFQLDTKASTASLPVVLVTGTTDVGDSMFSVSVSGGRVELESSPLFGADAVIVLEASGAFVAAFSGTEGVAGLLGVGVVGLVARLGGVAGKAAGELPVLEGSRGRGAGAAGFDSPGSVNGGALGVVGGTSAEFGSGTR